MCMCYCVFSCFTIVFVSGSVIFLFYFLFFFFKQKTAYEMRISDWSSDVCSSDLIIVPWEKYHHPSPLFRLPRTFFGYALTAVPLGVARNVINGLRDLGLSKSAPGRGRLADSGFAQYAVAKAEALVEAGLLSARHSFHELWRAAVAGEEASMEACARVRRACVHAAESSLEAANLCYRAAGGSALFASAPFEAGVRDISAMLGHLVFQRTM